MTENKTRTTKDTTIINTTEVVNYLSRTFARATAKASEKIGTKAVRTVNKGIVETTQLYDLQVEFSYLVDNITRSPSYIVPKYIQQANELIASIEAM